MAPIRWVAGTALALAFAGCSGLVTDSDLESDGGAPTADAATADAGPPPPPPNIILILTDDQRWTRGVMARRIRTRAAASPG